MSNAADAPLAKVDLFAGMEERTLGRLVELGRDVSYDAGVHIFKEGVAPKDGDPILHVILEGEASVQIRGEDRARLCPGDYFGEIMLLDRCTPSATIIAGPDGLQALTLGWSPDFSALFGHPEFSKRLVMALCQRLRDLELYDVTWAFKGPRVPAHGHA